MQCSALTTWNTDPGTKYFEQGVGGHNSTATASRNADYRPLPFESTVFGTIDFLPVHHSAARRVLGITGVTTTDQAFLFALYGMGETVACNCVFMGNIQTWLDAISNA